MPVRVGNVTVYGRMDEITRVRTTGGVPMAGSVSVVNTSIWPVQQNKRLGAIGNEHEDYWWETCITNTENKLQHERQAL